MCIIGGPIVQVIQEAVYFKRAIEEPDDAQRKRLVRAGQIVRRRAWRRARGYSPAELRYHPEAPKVTGTEGSVSDARFSRLQLARSHELP